MREYKESSSNDYPFAHRIRFNLKCKLSQGIYECFKLTDNFKSMRMKLFYQISKKLFGIIYFSIYHIDVNLDYN